MKIKITHRDYAGVETVEYKDGELSDLALLEYLKLADDKNLTCPCLMRIDNLCKAYPVVFNVTAYYGKNTHDESIISAVLEEDVG